MKKLQKRLQMLEIFKLVLLMSPLGDNRLASSESTKNNKNGLTYQISVL